MVVSPFKKPSKAGGKSRSAFQRSIGKPPPPPVEFAARGHERFLAATLAIAAILLFSIAANLNPYDNAGLPRGHGTHRQLGLPSCSFQAFTGIGCPSCGMTTTFSLLMHGDPEAAWRTNWAGCVIAVLILLDMAWFFLIVIGVPTRGFTTDYVIARTAIVGVIVAMLRWSVLLVTS